MKSAIIENRFAYFVCILPLYGLWFEEESYILYSITLILVGTCDFQTKACLFGRQLMWLFSGTPNNNGRNFRVRRVLKGGETHHVIILCSLLFFLPNFVSVMHIGSRLPL